MAGKKLTALTEVTELGDDSLIYIVDPSRASGDRSVGIDKDVFASLIETSPISTNPVENNYADQATMLADQTNQTESFFQYQIDTDEYWEKLAASTGIIANYRLLSDTETEIIRDSNSYRVFRIQYIQDDGTPITSIRGGRIGFEYSGANVTAIVFNARYTDAIEEFYNTAVNIKFYNRTTQKYQTESILNTAWTTVNTDYYRAAVTGTNIQIADLTVNDRVEFFISQAAAAGGGVVPVEKTGNTIIFTERANYNQTTPATSGNITLNTTGAVVDTVIAFFYNGATEPTISGATNLIKSGRFIANTDLIYWFLWMNGKYTLNIQANNKQTLLAPTNFVASSVSTTSISLTWTAVTNADGYELLSSTTNDIGTASEIYSGALLTYIHTGRTAGIINYYWLKAEDSSDFFNESNYSTANASSEDPVIIYQDDFAGTTIDTAIWDETTATNGVITQNNQIELSVTAIETNFFGLILKTAVGSTNDMIIGQTKLTIPNTANITPRVGICTSTYSSTETAFFTRSSVVPHEHYRTIIIDGGTSEILPNSLIDSGIDVRIKYVPSTGDVTFEYYSGTWIEFTSSSGNVDLGSTIKFFIYAKADSNTSEKIIVDNFYISNDDYSSQYPS